ncbi:MAG: DNA-3-methyladenine glycosylase I [Marinobacter excellens HL-55]|uniref:DNA-3-methyladenine glycosylase I n=1 Tax=Marinobacter excellens HL-55 TaxID=1305731 RepID=A0A0P8BQ95_9GAMM|nr:MAG: DNA-3-methyladenine glycosylase I [Marinobacter excellens HL-55]
MTQPPERCSWCGTDPLYVHYHDTVWGRPEYDDYALFEKLCLDGQQAGLSWITILRKQQHYRDAYANFDPEKIARFTAQDEARLLLNPGIVRNKLKVRSVINNARGYLALQERDTPLSSFLWQFMDHKPLQNQWRTMAEVPTQTPQSEAMSKALKKAGFTFVGPTIVYAFMQATGMVNDHLVSCPAHQACLQLSQ